jgi:hypothetical protein
MPVNRGNTLCSALYSLCLQSVTLEEVTTPTKKSSVRVVTENLVGQINPLTPNNLQRCRAVNPLKIKIPSKNMRGKPTGTLIIHLVY